MNFVIQETFSHCNRLVCQLWKLYSLSIVVSGIHVAASSLPMCLRLSEVRTI